MKEEKLYDYSRGLNAPYWIQEIKTKKGHTDLVLRYTHAVVLFYRLHPRLLWGCYCLEESF